MQLDLHAILITALAAGSVVLIGMWILYFWLKHTGRLPARS